MLSSLRKARKTDEALVSSIQSAAYSRPWTHRHVALAIENNEVWLCGDEGFIIYEFIAPECELSLVAIHPRAQRRGVGLELMRAMIDDCVARKIEKIFLEVEEANEAAIALYRKLGFVEFSERADYYGPYRHAVLMQLQLAPKPSN